MKCKVRALMLMLLMCWASQSSAQPTRAKATYGVCEFINSVNHSNRTKHQGLNGDIDAGLLVMDLTGHQEVSHLKDFPALGGAADSVIILLQPKNGQLIASSQKLSDFTYRPNPDFIGNDKAIILVTYFDDATDKTVEFKLVYYFKVIDKDNFNVKKLCPKGMVWPISVPKKYYFEQNI